MKTAQNTNGLDLKNAENKNETIRVNLALLDELMIYAGELVLARNQLMRLTTELTRTIPGLSSVLQDIDMTTSTIQERIMNTRMQPISLVFNRFPRLIRDMTMKNKKKIQLETSGGEVNLDKSVVENLYDPLAVVMNFLVDRDIESPEDRVANKKDETALINLRAYQEGGKVNVDIISDGIGIDTQKVLNTAVANGFVKANEAERFGRKDILDLLFMHNFFLTTIKLDEGEMEVGLHDVRDMLEKIGGSIGIDIGTSNNTVINVKLPLTLVIIPSIIIKVNEQNFAIPQVSLQEIVRLRQGDDELRIEQVNEAPVLRLRNKLLPILYLQKVLNMEAKDKEDKTVRIMVMKHDENEFGLVVDEIFDHEEIVVKNIPRFFKNSMCYAGTTIMGDGTVALILDIGGVAGKAKLNFTGLKDQTIMGDEMEQRMHDDMQNLLLFENAKGQFFALNLDLIRRIEKISKNDIDIVGEKEYIEHEGKSLHVIRLEQYLPVQAPEKEDTEQYVIIPKSVENPIGIIVHRIVDSISVNTEIDSDSIMAKGLIGSALIKDDLVLFPDIYELIEMAEPEKVSKHRQRDKKKKTILLVEDTPFFRSLEKNYLESAGYSVDLAIDGMDGFKKATSKAYDLFVVDIVMPRMDGYQFVEAIRRNPDLQEVPALALTTLSSEESKEKAFQSGFNAYEVKVNKDKLLETVSSLLYK
ncbi:MAG: chemotaxis protein CheW [Candidatus Cloacimonadales bacterium]|jgi:two-component system chemotaxis sensor kinase CheA|nr:chemotaxis protein CheW [Candidatus Cloacimonadales bacterium]